MRVRFPSPAPRRGESLWLTAIFISEIAATPFDYRSSPQKVSFAPAAPLQARSPCLRCTTNFLRKRASLFPLTQFAIIASAVVANFFARAELTGELRFCAAKWEFLNSQAISPGSRRNAVQATSRAPKKVTLRLRCSLINALTTLRLATNFLRKRARAWLFLYDLRLVFLVSCYVAALKTGRHCKVSAGFYFFSFPCAALPTPPGLACRLGCCSPVGSV